jgi:hypothetical protein
MYDPIVFLHKLLAGHLFSVKHSLISFSQYNPIKPGKHLHSV